MMPNQPPSQASSAAREQPVSPPLIVQRPVYRWYHKVWAVLLVTFCLEIGLFLVLFPWTHFWQANYFAGLLPAWHGFWNNNYFRGAVSGLGALDLYIALTEIFRLRRFVRGR